MENNYYNKIFRTKTEKVSLTIFRQYKWLISMKIIIHNLPESVYSMDITIPNYCRRNYTKNWITPSGRNYNLSIINANSINFLFLI